MASAKTHLLPLTGIRFFLALWVVVFHQRFFTGYAWLTPLPGAAQSLVRTGYLAVGMFFMLSGLVLSYNYSLDEAWAGRQWKKFLVARLARVYPAYALALLLSVPWVVMTVYQHRSLGALLKESARTVLAWGLMQAWIPAAAEAWNRPGWSLSVEAFFYCCFPLIGVALWKMKRPWALGCVFAGLWIVSLAAPAVAWGLHLNDAAGGPASLWNADSTGGWVSFIKFEPLFHLPEFCAGIVIGRVYQGLRRGNSPLIGRGYWLYLPGIVCEVAAIAKWQPILYTFLHNGLLLPLHAVVILGLALGGGTVARILSSGSMVLLGNASYSVYIFQSPVASWVALIAKWVFSRKVSGIGITAIYVVVLVGFSVAMFKLLEERANGFLKKWLTSPSGNSRERVSCEDKFRERSSVTSPLFEEV